MMKHHNHISDFTKEELARVDQHKHEEALFVLRHSSAAREVFSHMQYVRSFDSDDLMFFTEEMAYANSLAIIAREVMIRHWWARSRMNPRRIFSATSHRFTSLAEDLGVETYEDDLGETHIKTIDGWWMV